MSKNPEKDTRVREERQRQILQAALAVYIRHGYYGTDMDAVAAEAGLAKGLLYYYFKKKNDLFRALYLQVFSEGRAFADALLEQYRGASPVEVLLRYTHSVFCENRATPQMMRFYIRAPFDAYAVFGQEGKAVAEQSFLHKAALEAQIGEGVRQGEIPQGDPGRMASAFWSVFVANLFDYSVLMEGRVEADGREAFTEIVRFCFQGLGVGNALWQGHLAKIYGGEVQDAEGV